MNKTPFSSTRFPIRFCRMVDSILENSVPAPHPCINSSVYNQYKCKIDTAEMQSEKQPNSHSANLEETYANTTLGRPYSLEAPTLKVLGVLWDLHKDCLQFEITYITEIAASIEPTKRIKI